MESQAPKWKGTNRLSNICPDVSMSPRLCAWMQDLLAINPLLCAGLYAMGVHRPLEKEPGKFFAGLLFHQVSVNRTFYFDFKLCGSEECLFFMLKYRGRKRFSFLTAGEYNCEGRIERWAVSPEYQLYIAHIPGRERVLSSQRSLQSESCRCFTASKREGCCVQTTFSSLIIEK